MKSMAKTQTKIPFLEKKRTSLRSIGKENIEKKSPNITQKESESQESCITSKCKDYKRSLNSVNSQSDSDCSPPKRDCSNTPTQLMDHLTVKDLPCTKFDVLSCKKLFPGDKINAFHEAQKALHSSSPISLPGREDKLSMLKEYLTRHLNNKTSGTLYVSGPPGTGKTVCLNSAIGDNEIKKGYKVIYVNCTSMKSSSTIYLRVCEELGIKCKGHSEKTTLRAIENHLTSTQRSILLVLDELDQLSSRSQSVLYSVFEWPSLSNSRLVLVGIANALDLTDRVLPRLRAHLQLQPELLHFEPYNRQQIVDIIADRLKQAGVNEVFPASALQLLAGKIAAVSGDIRRALDISRRVIELAENKNILQPLNGDKTHTIDLQDVMMVMNNVYNTTQCLDTSESDDFPIQQKLLICSLLLILQTSKTKDVAIGKLHDVYRKVCEKRNISSVDLSEFLSLTSLVSSRGILRVIGKNHNRFSKVVLQWDQKEVAAALEDKQLLAVILNDKSIV
uniref:Cell division control protein n=1 Tax=Clastoptera arizonana TaxID=38151 RepID=A0A1B6CXR5_9HEMI